MADYKKMYLTLVDEVTKTIDGLTAALQKAEDIYIDSAQQQAGNYHLLKNNSENEADAN